MPPNPLCLGITWKLVKIDCDSLVLGWSLKFPEDGNVAVRHYPT